MNTTQQQEGEKRTKLIKKNILASVLIKGWASVVQLAMVPLTLKCIGVYENGIWLTISAMLLWIDNLDIGLGNGLRNKLATFIAQGEIDNARKAVTTTFFMLIVIIIPVMLCALLLVKSADIYNFLNVDSNIVGNLRQVLYVSIIFVSSTFIFKFIGNFYMGMQLLAINNLLVTLGQSLALVGTFIIFVTGCSSLLMIAIANTLPPLLVYLISYPITFSGKYKDLRPHYKYIDVSMMKELFSLGFQFFILQISSMLLFMSSNIIISKFFTPTMVTPYQITYRYFSLILLLLAIICAPYWSATTDAYNKGDRKWMEKTNITLNKILLLIILILVAMVIVSKYVFRIWVGSSVEIPTSMIFVVASYILILAISTRYSYILNGLGLLRLQLIMTVVAATTYVPIAILVSHYTSNINYLLAVMCIVNTPGLVVNFIQHKKIMRQKASGIWMK